MSKFKLGFVLSVLVITGCATRAMPNFYNGKYYMAGDSSCTHIKELSESRIMCSNGDGQDTGYRDAMTDQQLQMYRHNEQMEAASQPVTCYTNYGTTTCY